MTRSATRSKSQQHSFVEQIAEKFNGVHSNFVLGSTKENNPIVYCTDGFCELTQYNPQEIIRRNGNCNFLYGVKTPQDHIDAIRTALDEQTEFQVKTIFYKKDGSPFDCLFDILPIKNDDDKVVMFVASHKDLLNQSFDESGRKEYIYMLNAFKIIRIRFRAVLYHLSEQLSFNGQTKTETDKITERLVLTAKNANDVKVKHVQRPIFLILHYSRLKLAWDWSIIALTFFIAIMVPLFVAFKIYSLPVVILPQICFIIDILLNFRTTYIDSHGHIVYQSKRIAANYMKTWLIIDLTASIPLELIIDYENASLSLPVTLLKLLRLLHLIHFMAYCDRKFEYNAAVLALLLLSFATLAHWLACIWYIIGNQELMNNQRLGWLYELSLSLNEPYYNSTSGGPSLQDKYVTALYFTLSSLTTVGFGNVSGNTTAEKVFAVITMIIGSLMYAVIFGNVTAIIQRIYSARSKFRSRMYDIRQFCHAYHLPKQLKYRLEDFTYTDWSVTNGINKEEVLKTLPVELQTDICQYLHREFLGLSLFQSVSNGCMRNLSSRIQTSYCAPSEIVIYEGELYHPLYFVASGTLQVFRNDVVVAILGHGDLIGEFPLQSTSSHLPKSTGTVKALTYCDLRYINHFDLKQVTESYPELGQVLQNEWNLAYNLGEDDVPVSKYK
ncbi:uncharacterized protein TRIADDRAFT_30951 [Trichoplax adhaerens]|uniref:Cyclic nucleotide-binding domain-containing protein n=1 Tax=Trichoplax adhaerens TaxID=10228 RepID=B3S8A5_TRIAD|nr:hypothetical protein TRIADDRAFT_30951 [Trichoplax adhaerens]EDV21067.1 hypothetical protein TRIADDRAFT_30951 [Trichoplax adhaerens]|eukprot:XP_002116397.1 hypothetical protein TRIADDRAFT_30951 [Trichoplax adhaerens]